MTKQQKLDSYKSKYPESFEHHRLNGQLQTFQLWNNGSMLTANLPRMDAISGVKNGSYYVISAQAVGYVNDLLN